MGTESGQLFHRESKLSSCTARSHRERKWAVVQRADIDVRPPSSPSTFPSAEEEWVVVSRDDTNDESHCYEPTSVESSDSDKTYELPDHII